jgi:hypothetical protein
VKLYENRRLRGTIRFWLRPAIGRKKEVYEASILSKFGSNLVIPFF